MAERERKAELYSRDIVASVFLHSDGEREGNRRGVERLCVVCLCHSLTFYSHSSGYLFRHVNNGLWVMLL